MSEQASSKEYKHFLVCNGDRRYPAGEPGHSCSCFNSVHAAEAQSSPRAGREAQASDWSKWDVFVRGNVKAKRLDVITSRLRELAEAQYSPRAGTLDDLAREIMDIFWPNGTTQAQDAVFDAQLAKVNTALAAATSPRAGREALEALVAKWQAIANKGNDSYYSAYENCAEELNAALAAATATHSQPIDCDCLPDWLAHGVHQYGCKSSRQPFKAAEGMGTYEPSPEPAMRQVQGSPMDKDLADVASKGPAIPERTTEPLAAATVERTPPQIGEQLLRRELWLSHGHVGIYGDDGEMQCGECGIDYKRDSVEQIIARRTENGMRALAIQAADRQPPAAAKPDAPQGQASVPEKPLK